MSIEQAPEVHETHTGLVVLVGDRAYKTKRPVVTAFLDFSTAQLRERACAREVELNSRLASCAYLGIAHLRGPGAAESEPVVVMRRYPDSARLSRRIGSVPTVAAELSAVATTLAQFHATARRGADIDAEATVPAVARRWDANLEEMRRYAGAVIAEEALRQVAALSHRFLTGCAEVFCGRIAGRRIVDGHGDLLADDIFTSDDGPVLLDCLDFDDRLRYVDGIDDAAFLAMDLEFLGRPELARQFMADYRTLADDPAPRSLAHFYIAYRALVRAKVDCIRVDQSHAEAAADARRHLQITVDHLRAAIPRLVLVGGGPGTGKTTLSRALAESVGAEVISTDDVRKGLLDQGVIDGPAGAVNAGLYAPDKVATVYEEVLRRARVALTGGSSVILDGTWRDPAKRVAARDLADRTQAAFVGVACTTPLAAAQGRIEHRVGSSSEATTEIAAALAAETAGGWPGAYRVDTGRPMAETIEEVAQYCRRAI